MIMVGDPTTGRGIHEVRRQAVQGEVLTALDRRQEVLLQAAGESDSGPRIVFVSASGVQRDRLVAEGRYRALRRVGVSARPKMQHVASEVDELSSAAALTPAGS